MSGDESHIDWFTSEDSSTKSTKLNPKVSGDRHFLEQINGLRVRACGETPPPLLLHFPAMASLSSVSLKQRSPQRSLMKLDLLIRSCRQHLAPSRKLRTSTSFGLHPAPE
jgi:hypothetical protein